MNDVKGYEPYPHRMPDYWRQVRFIIELHTYVLRIPGIEPRRELILSRLYFQLLTIHDLLHDYTNASTAYCGLLITNLEEIAYTGYINTDLTGRAAQINATRARCANPDTKAFYFYTELTNRTEYRLMLDIEAFTRPILALTESNHKNEALHEILRHIIINHKSAHNREHDQGVCKMYQKLTLMIIHKKDITTKEEKTAILAINNSCPNPIQ